MMSSNPKLIRGDIEICKMAGRVERRINDKFYFVLDEVGGSSDCESELTENDAKLATPVIQKVTGRNEKDSNTSQNDMNEFKHPDVQSINCNKNTPSADCISRKSEMDTEIIVLDATYPQSCEKERENAGNDSLPGTVDMEIDSDVECLNKKQEPIFKVTFRDIDAKKRFKSSVYKFFSFKCKDCKVINIENGLGMYVYEKGPKEIKEEKLLDFNLDTTPGDSHLEVPNYGKAHNFILSDKSLEENQNTEKVVMCCFNCQGNHNLRDCKLKKNFEVINKNRIIFQSKPQKDRVAKLSRYHLDDTQKYARFKPGVISKKLRNALCLQKDQQAGFIYRMRLLGYPPGWLEEAKVSHSGVAMYDDRGVRALDEDEEEGEIVPEGARDKFDINKIIEFPGFNIPLPPHYRDETKNYRCPELSEEQSIENLIDILRPKTVTAYIKKSLTGLMNEKLEKDEKGGSSPTIEEMEEKKRQLLLELNNESPAAEPKSSSSDVPMKLTPPKESAPAKEVGSVKNLEFGTPILKSISPFAKLPSREQFSCDMNDIIQFENLPNSTGKYETIRHVITKIRTTTSKNLKSDD